MAHVSQIVRVNVNFKLSYRGPPDKHQASTNISKIYARAVIESKRGHSQRQASGINHQIKDIRQGVIESKAGPTVVQLKRKT